MERNLSFPSESVVTLRVRLTWGQAELLTGESDQFQVLIAGDDDSVEEVRAEMRGGEVLVAQPQLAYAKELLPRNRWLQICVRVPKGWRGDLEASTVAGMLGARSLALGDLSLTTVSGSLRANQLSGDQLFLHTVAGAISGEALQAKRVNLRTVSGRVALKDLGFITGKAFTVSGEVNLLLRDGCRALDVQSVSGGICIETASPAQGALHSLSGQFIRGDGVQWAEGGLEVSASSVSGDLVLKGREEV
jgi:hypothetical protein